MLICIKEVSRLSKKKKLKKIQKKAGKEEKGEKGQRGHPEKKQDDRHKRNNTFNYIKCKWTKTLSKKQMISNLRNIQLHAFCAEI